MLLSDTPCAKVNCLSIMGEEKPEEELMGKRKSSPRLSATPLRRYHHVFQSLCRIYIICGINFPVGQFYGGRQL
ncbi:hypothetical protein EDM57_16275 [Brevibacillus gelatini]|uniref:Uncharacterized protein n=1 Tax=Brevibacillus gelatini TaxID=1655277 RepID=A0A3M8ATT4_9BACL|nr:hypothetical protein EDM57_16275 [Brevibacillus gelatini]